MQITFIGSAILCGVGLGGLLVLILMALRKATPQRTKWAMLGSASLTTLVAVVFTVYVALSPTQEQQIRQRFQSIPNSDQSVQWYEYTCASSSATGECASTSTHRWFGLDSRNDEKTLLDWYDHQLANDGWQLQNTVWRKDAPQGIFTLDIEVFTETALIDPRPWFYRIPDDVLKQAMQYSTTYVLRLTLGPRCLGQ